MGGEPWQPFYAAPTTFGARFAAEYALHIYRPSRTVVSAKIIVHVIVKMSSEKPLLVLGLKALKPGKRRYSQCHVHFFRP